MSAPVEDVWGVVAGNGGPPPGDRADLAGDPVWHDGFGAGWDACAAFMAEVVESERAAELDPANWTPWLDDEFDGEDPPGFGPAGAECLTCGGHGSIPCSWCDGTGVERAGWSDDESCGVCAGTGDEVCPDCLIETGGGLS